METMKDAAFANLVGYLQRQSGNHTSPRSILSLGCGGCSEVPAILKVLNDQASDSLFIGIDIRTSALETANQLLGASTRLLSGGTSVELLRQDASQLHRLKELPRKFDLILFRHQNYWHDPRLWTAMFEVALSRLSPSGSILLSSYFDLEHAMALGSIVDLGGTVFHNYRNPCSATLKVPGKSIDRWISLIGHGDMRRANQGLPFQPVDQDR